MRLKQDQALLEVHQISATKKLIMSGSEQLSFFSPGLCVFPLENLVVTTWVMVLKLFGQF